MQYVCPRCHGRLMYDNYEEHFVCTQCARPFGQPTPVDDTHTDVVRYVNGRYTVSKRKRVLGARGTK